MNRDGYISVKALFWILVLAGVVYGAYKFAPPYISYYMLKTDVENEAKNGYIYSNATLAKHILTKAAGWSVPLKEEDLEIDRGETEIRVALHYKVTLDFPGGYAQDINYDIDVVAPLKETSRILQ